MRIAIFGGTGSVGTVTAVQLAQRGIVVSILSRRRPVESLHQGITWSQVDVADAISVRESLARMKVDGVVHLAALLQFACEDDPAGAVRINVDGTLNILEACRELKIPRLIFGSSIAVYGERMDLMRESDPAPADLSLYGFSKLFGELLGQRYRGSSGVDFVALRYSGVFGPGVATSPGMAQVRQRIFDSARGEDVTVDGASGKERIHLTHVNDAAKATCAALLADRPAHSVYNVAGPADSYISLQDLHNIVRDVVPNSGCVRWKGSGRSAGPVDTTRISEDFGWVPTYSLRDGIRDVLMRAHQVSSAFV